MIVDPASPPDLSNTVITAAAVDGRTLPNREFYWNRLLFFVVRHAMSKVGPARARALIVCGTTAGKIPGRGYEFIPEMGISIRGQNANVAWRATYHIIQQSGMTAEINFNSFLKPSVRGTIRILPL